ncbi:pantetheine-phosphate adenylyltransferase [Lepagella muris]|jgi:pantetheine-phosphate adenylyltransferase|uniref:Pantetheine-phosphate adenylyltransferase n=1 Tax=Lepagella muris TaxID=3032870 RepID=A0AC61RJI3_9BACT|nr:pantetheine-phosphate adenylyltransferase [Lepagella muris]ROT08074.1 pantetheine-phosphate adenylyltransferase [Muribaculaceae bacterium Isolate-037 (Harlan)]TGY80346.1 pantetheine-phosphate adenylyltransferase [Lepagella muris]THG52885.1 pantetheine-phosphate adenylyltransferase [Bacteroidales bacterium]TKC58665.1 pantetheine-phosphate adenylyltransferase [Bacteroidales bacterium]
MKALFAGSFDPFTIGHQSIVERGLKIFDKLIIAVGYNEHKPGEWTAGQREKAISALYQGDPRIDVATYTGLTVDFARHCGADVLLRGVRSMADFEYERNIADTNRAIAGMETVILIAKPEFSFVSSSIVRELMHNGHDVRKYIAGDFPLP